jgi:ligand-binding sensor domain-containing protein
MKTLIVMFYSLVSLSALYAKNPEWVNYTNGQYVPSLAIEGDNVWIGTNGGLVKLNKTTGEELFFNRGNSGLPDNEVTSIAIDGSGNKWIGTGSGGLAKFDGTTTWIVYMTSNSGMPSNSIASIAIDGAGNKWIGTTPYLQGNIYIGGGLAKFDGTTWTVYDTSNSSLPDNNISSLAIDGSGNKWIGTLYAGLAKYDGKTWTDYTTLNSGLPDNYVTSIAIDASGNKWIGTDNGGLARFDSTHWSVYTKTNSGLPDNMIMSMAIDNSGNKWIGGFYGLAKYDSTNWTVYTTSNSNLPNNYVTSIAIDGSGNKWIATNYFLTSAASTATSNLAKFNGTNWTMYPTSNSSMPDNEVFSIAIDSSGNKWIGTYYRIIFIDSSLNFWDTNGGGLAKFDGIRWTVYTTLNSGLPDNYVTSIAIDASGNKWIGTNKWWDGVSIGVGGRLIGGLAKFDGTNWSVYTTSNSGMPDNHVWSIAIDGSGNKWIGTQSGGLSKFDGTNWTVYQTSNSSLPSNYIHSLAIDGSGTKWIGTMGGGLAKLDGTTWTVYDTLSSGLPSNDVLSIAIDGSWNKWIGTGSGGLTKFDGTTWTVYNSSNSGLPDNNVSSVAIDGSGNKWIGTYGGLTKYDGINWAVYNRSNSGLSDDYVSSIAIDGSGNKWIGTLQNGVAVYNGGGVVSVKEITSKYIPNVFALNQNYPNPFNPTTTITFSVGTHSYVSLQVYDMLGREVATLINQEKLAGRYQVTFDASKLSSGVYFYRLKAGSYIQTQKMLLLR